MSDAIIGPSSVSFQALAVRVVSARGGVTHLLVGGVDDYADSGGAYLAYGRVAAGSSLFVPFGSFLVPSVYGGLTALSQTSTLSPGYVLASTDQGVFRCDPLRSWTATARRTWPGQS